MIYVNLTNLQQLQALMCLQVILIPQLFCGFESLLLTLQEDLNNKPLQISALREAGSSGGLS